MIVVGVDPGIVNNGVVVAKIEDGVVKEVHMKQFSIESKNTNRNTLLLSANELHTGILAWIKELGMEPLDCVLLEQQYSLNGNFAPDVISMMLGACLTTIQPKIMVKYVSSQQVAAYLGTNRNGNYYQKKKQTETLIQKCFPVVVEALQEVKNSQNRLHDCCDAFSLIVCYFDLLCKKDKK